MLVRLKGKMNSTTHWSELHWLRKSSKRAKYFIYKPNHPSFWVYANYSIWTIWSCISDNVQSEWHMLCQGICYSLYVVEIYNRNTVREDIWGKTHWERKWKENKPLRENTVRENTARENTVRENTARENTVRENTVREYSEREYGKRIQQERIRWKRIR